MSGCARDYYLNTLGVVQYVPREFFLPEQQAVPSVEQPAPMVEGKRPAIDLSVLTEAKTTQSAPKPEAAPNPVEAVKEAPQSEQVRFRICYWQVADVLIFGSLDYGENPPQDQHQLLNNIVQSVGRLSAPLPEPELMDWPLVPSAPADAEGARAMLAAFLDARVKQNGARWVLVMGDRASDYLLSKAPAAEDGRIQFSEQCQVIVTPGLAEMLAEPECKRTTWQAIRFLADTRPV